MFENILVPLDGSLLSEQALPVAAALARSSAARVTLLQAIVVPVYAPMPVYMHSSNGANEHHAVASATNYLRGIKQQLCSEGVSNVEITVTAHDAPDAIITAAREGCDLIVMSTHGRTGLPRTILGSVADEVVRNSHLPVLLITTQQHVLQRLDPAYSFRRILVALDGSAQANEMLPVAGAVAAAHGAKLLLLYVMPERDNDRPQGVAREPQAPYQTLIPRYLNRAALASVPDSVDYDIIEATGTPAEAIIREAELNNCNLIMMTTHGRVGLERMRLGSVAEDVLKASAQPVLLLHSQDITSKA